MSNQPYGKNRPEAGVCPQHGQQLLDAACNRRQRHLHGIHAASATPLLPCIYELACHALLGRIAASIAAAEQQVRSGMQQLWRWWLLLIAVLVRRQPRHRVSLARGAARVALLGQSVPQTMDLLPLLAVSAELGWLPCAGHEERRSLAVRCVCRVWGARQEKNETARTRSKVVCKYEQAK